METNSVSFIVGAARSLYIRALKRIGQEMKTFGSPVKQKNVTSKDK